MGHKTGNCMEVLCTECLDIDYSTVNVNLLTHYFHINIILVSFFERTEEYLNQCYIQHGNNTPGAGMFK